MKPKTVSRYVISLAKATWFDFGLNNIKFTIVVYYDLDPDTSHINNKTWFPTLLSCDLEPDIAIYTPGRLSYQDFETQHTRSRWIVATNSYPATGILSHHLGLILDGKWLAYCANHILLTVRPMILKSWRRTKNEQSNMDTYGNIIHLYTL